MAPVFTINFRREVYQRELARSRARVISLGVWLSYFGILVVIFGLYGLNFATVVQRTRAVKRQAAAMRETRSQQTDWTQRPGEMSLIERGVGDSRRWRLRLERLAMALPGNTRLTAIEFNPGGSTGGAGSNRLLLTGILQASPNEDRMNGVTRVVSALRADSAFSRQFRTIRLASTSIAETDGSTANFSIECQP